MKTQIKKIEWETNNEAALGFLVMELVCKVRDDGDSIPVFMAYGEGSLDDINATGHTLEAARANFQTAFEKWFSDLTDKFTEPVPCDVTFVAGPE